MKDLTPLGVWLFIVGRVIVALGLGILAMAYFPEVAFPAALPLIAVGLVILVVAFLGMRKGDGSQPK